MNESQKKHQKKINALKKALESNNEKKILEAIKESRDEGDEQLIPVLVNILKNSSNNKVKDEIFSLLNDLKSQKTVWPLIQEIEKVTDRTLKAQLIAVLWQAGLETSEYLDELLKWAMDEDFFIANEAITVLENISPTLSEEELMNYLYDISEEINSLEDDNPRKNLLLSLAEILKTYTVE
jgi:HEAT repeat protein